MVKPRLTTGSVIDGFVVGDVIAKGGMSILWQVTHPGMDLPMIMKVPVLFEGEDPAAIVGFEMEQMILPRLSGPHVPKFIAAGDFSVQPYLVMEHLPGPSLLKRLPELPLPIGEIADIGARIALALDDLHRQHVIHLDIKPSNVLFRSSGEAVLIDYGLAHHDQLPDLMSEEFRLPFGTAPYMAPEQILGARHDPRSDLFALGALMYFFTTNVRPFGDPQRMSGLKRRLWRDPVPPRKLRPDCPPWLQEIILRCLEINPERRYPTAAQLAFDLQNHNEVTLTARAEKLNQDPWTEVWRRRFNEDAQPIGKKLLARQIAGAPIIMAAIDLSEDSNATADAIRLTIARILQSTPETRLACVNILKQARMMLDTTLDARGHNKHVDRLVKLKHWASPLNRPEGTITFHVLEAVDPAAAILEFATANRVDHIVMGARAKSRLRPFLGSVSAEVAAKAPCTVTVVRSHAPASAVADEN